MTAVQETPTTAAPAARRRVSLGPWRAVIAGSLVLILLSIVQNVSDGADDLTSSGTASAALRLSVPILLAGLGGLWAERAGVVNIGLEGMMILGTWFGAWAGFEYGPWQGALMGAVGGALGGLVHAIATVSFGVDHIVSGVAINILASGVTRFLSSEVFTTLPGGGENQSPRVSGDVGDFSLPLLSGGFDTWDPLANLARKNWFFVSDVAGILNGVTSAVSWLTLIAFGLVGFSAWFLWRTPFGLRLRSAGENPVGAETLGVNVYLMKYVAVVASGMFAGLGGAFLVLEQATIYREGQTGGRGFLGLAAMLFGNWMPGGLALGAGLFGYADALQLRSEAAVHALLLFIAVGAGLLAAYFAFRRRVVPSIVFAVVGVAFFVWWSSTDSVDRDIVRMTPYITTLVVLALATQRTRMPSADGLRWRRRAAV